MKDWMKTGVCMLLQILFLVSVFAMSAFSESERIELEVGYEAYEEYKTYPLPEGYDYKSLDESIVVIDENNLLIAKDFGNTFVEVYDGDEIVHTYEVIVYLVGDEPVPWGNVTPKKPFVTGYPDQTLRPERNITFGELMTMFAKLMDLKVEASPTNSHWASGYIEAIKQLDMFSLLKDKGPDEFITKEEMAYVIHQYADFYGFELPNASQILSDVNFNHPFYTFIQEALYMKLMASEEDLFYPNMYIKRIEAILILNTLNEREIHSVQNLHFTDVNETMPYYQEIIKATALHN